MLTKLTLSVDDQVIEKAKEFARKTDRSLSKIVENYLKSLTTEKGIAAKQDVIDELAGKIKLRDHFDIDEARREMLEQKYV